MIYKAGLTLTLKHRSHSRLVSQYRLNYKDNDQIINQVKSKFRKNIYPTGKNTSSLSFHIIDQLPKLAIPSLPNKVSYILTFCHLSTLRCHFIVIPTNHKSKALFSYLALPLHPSSLIFHQLLQKPLSTHGTSTPFSAPEDPYSILLWDNLHGAQEPRSHQGSELKEQIIAPHTEAAKMSPFRSLSAVLMEI